MQQQRLPSLIDPPILFGHRGARAVAPDNTLESFDVALRLGATGLESDVWLTADDVVVCDHDGVVPRGRFRKQPIAEVNRADLPEHIPTLADLVTMCADGIAVSIDLKVPGIGPRVIETVREVAPDMLPRLWLCDPDLERLVELRPFDAMVKLVHSTRLHRLDGGPERHAATLAEAGIDALNLRQPDWNGGLVTLMHRFGRFALMWDVQHDHQLRPALRMGIDGIFSDHVDRMVTASATEIGLGPAEYT